MNNYLFKIIINNKYTLIQKTNPNSIIKFSKINYAIKREK